MKELLKHREAFEKYFADGKDRNLEGLASACKVAVNTCKRWSKAFDWQKRIVERDKKIADRVEKMTDVSIAKEKFKYRKILKLVIEKCFLTNKEGELVGCTVKAETVKDIDTIIKTDLLLMGDATERIEVNELSNLSEEELRSRRKASQELLDKVDGNDE